MNGTVGERIVVGMSGGVDSSLAAALLVEEGHEVIGITMHLAGSQSRCCSLEDAEDARRVAERLGIHFYVANYKAQFRSEVMEPFADAYLAGRTPIPCVACNKRFKFDHLLARARALGASAVATGHYARLAVDTDSGERRLLRARDREKDQSYFLFSLSPEQLAHTRFPLGGLTKEEVRRRARALGLATADKPESQEICFVPDGDYARVVAEIRPGASPGQGEIVDQDGQTLGRHPGIQHFTVGQRRGLGLSGATRRYVQAIEAPENRVRVGGEDDLVVGTAEISGLSWTTRVAPVGPLRARVQVRHRDEGAVARIEAHGSDRARVCFQQPVRAVAPGQAAVFYDGEHVLGGGWIEATERWQQAAPAPPGAAG